MIPTTGLNGIGKFSKNIKMEDGAPAKCYNAIPTKESEGEKSDVKMSRGTESFASFADRCLLISSNAIQYILPILDWLPAYNMRDNLHNDLVTGLTVGIMVVPQGMAYATLAGVDPVYGLYSCFFSAFFYMLFGTSKHISIGTFAVASMMVGSVCAKLLPNQQTVSGTAKLINGTLSRGTEGNGIGIPLDDEITPLMLTSTLTFGVGCFQLFLALFRLSFLTNYFSDSLISGFTTGAAVHVLTSQLDKLIGVKIKRHSGIGMILFVRK
uniref:SLC26A/SulP transporter domain-containing protein n=2 Tax=Globodera rostochiensis TaxID=31243 RepID=A0A914HX37_GLORO